MPIPWDDTDVQMVRLGLAAIAMHGLCSAMGYGKGFIINDEEISDDAFSIADTMLKRIEKEKKNARG